MIQHEIKLKDVIKVPKEKELVLLIDTQDDEYLVFAYKLFDLARENDELDQFVLTGLIGRIIVLNQGLSSWEPVKFKESRK